MAGGSDKRASGAARPLAEQPAKGKEEAVEQQELSGERKGLIEFNTFGAAQNLLKSEKPIGRMRGQVYTYGKRSLPVVVTYHPAYLLRSPGEKRKAWKDLLLAIHTDEIQKSTRL